MKPDGTPPYVSRRTVKPITVKSIAQILVPGSRFKHSRTILAGPSQLREVVNPITDGSALRNTGNRQPGRLGGYSTLVQKNGSVSVCKYFQRSMIYYVLSTTLTLFVILKNKSDTARTYVAFGEIICGVWDRGLSDWAAGHLDEVRNVSSNNPIFMEFRLRLQNVRAASHHYANDLARVFGCCGSKRRQHSLS